MHSDYSLWKRTTNYWERLESSMHTALIHQRGLNSGFHANRHRFRTQFSDDGPLPSYLQQRIHEPCLAKLPERLDSSAFGDDAAIGGSNRGTRWVCQV